MESDETAEMVPMAEPDPPSANGPAGSQDPSLDDGCVMAFEERLRSGIARLTPIATRMLNSFRRSATMNTTALIHDALLRLIASSKSRSLDAMSMRQIIGSAVLTMRSVLVERARRKQQWKRQVRLQSIGDGMADTLVAPAGPDLSLLECIDLAFQRIAARNPRVAQALELVYFGGLDTGECGAVLGVTDRQVRNFLNDGRRALALELRDLRPPGPHDAGSDAASGEA